MTVDITHDCISILNADKHLCILQSKHLHRSPNFGAGLVLKKLGPHTNLKTDIECLLVFNHSILYQPWFNVNLETLGDPWVPLTLMKAKGDLAA